MKTMALPAVLMAVWAVQGSPYLAHRFSFNGDLADSVGIIVPEAQGHAFVAIGTGQAVKLSGGTKGSSCVSLGENAIPASGVSATVELWARLDAKSNYARIFETGFNNANGFMTGMAWQRGLESSDFVFVNHGKNNTSSATDRLSPYAAGVWYHLAMVFTPCENGTWTVRAYKQDAETGETLAKTSFTAPSNWTFPKQYQKYFYLGRTYAGGDNDAAATYDELRIWTRALSERELSASARLGPDAAIADGEFPFGVAAFDTSCDLAKSASGFTSQGGIDKLGDGVLALSGENKVGEGIMAYDGVVHQVGGTLIASNAAVSVGAYDEKSSGRFIASHGAILEVTAIGGSATTEPERRSELVMDNATLRPLGSDLGHFGPKLVHRWSFNGDLSDSVGGQTAKTNGACSYSADGKAISLSGGTYGSSFVDLGPNILPADAKSATIEMWARQDSASTWARIFEIGVNKYYFAAMCWNRAGDVEQDYIEIKHNNVSKSAMDKLCPYSPGTEYHIAITYYEDADGKWKATAYKQDVATGATFAKTTFEGPEGWSLARMYQTFCYLGHAVVSGGIDASATYNEVRVWKGALTEAELTRNALLGPDSALPAASVPALRKTGTGTLTLKNADSIRGRILIVEGVLNVESADALPRSASIEVAFDGNGGHGALSCSHGVLDLSGIFLDVTGTPAGRTRIITSTDGITGKFAGKSLPAGYAVKISDTSVDVVLHEMVLTIR